MSTRIRIRIDRRGFIIYLVIIIAMIFGMFMYILSEMVDISASDENTARDDMAFLTYAQSRASLMTRFDTEKNSDGNTADRETCSGGLITAYADGVTLPSCSIGWSTGSDSIPDGVDNDNYKPSFMTGAIPMSAFSPVSRLEDDDDLARIHIIGSIPPGQTETVFAMNTPIQNIIALNTNNELIPTRMLPSLLTGALTLGYSVSSLSGTASFSTVDKVAFDQSRQVHVLSTKTGAIATLTGNLLANGSLGSTGSIAAMDIVHYDYALDITNTGTTVLTYDIWSPYGDGYVYITPMDDSKTPWRIRIARYDTTSDPTTLIYRTKDVMY